MTARSRTAFLLGVMVCLIVAVLAGCASGVDVHCAGDPMDPPECANQSR